SPIAAPDLCERARSKAAQGARSQRRRALQVRSREAEAACREIWADARAGEHAADARRDPEGFDVLPVPECVVRRLTSHLGADCRVAYFTQRRGGDGDAERFPLSLLRRKSERFWRASRAEQTGQPKHRNVGLSYLRLHHLRVAA